MRKKGFTLLEVMMVLLILSVFTVMALQSLNRGRHKAGAEGLASILSEELKRTRQEAIARRRPTALILPTNNGRASATRSFYIMEGETLPRIVRSRNYPSEFGGADIFMGRWPLSGGAWSATSLSVPGSKWSQFRVDTWLPSSAQALNDYCFVFLPDGTVQTNDLLSLDNRYHLVVAAGASYPAGASNATLTGTGEAYTISISPIGGVSVSRGVYGASSALASVGQHSTSVSHQAPQAIVVAKETPLPLTDMPEILPRPNPNTLPDTNPPDALITKEQYVSLEMRAKSTSGEQLFCKWVVEGPDPSDPNKKGAFSIQSEDVGNGAGGRMEWDQNLNNGVGAWRATWQWRPPPNALPGERYKLTCEVQNIGSGEGTVEIRRFEIRPPGKILFQSDRRPGHLDIFTMDESGQRERLYLPDAKHPTATLDGRRIIFVSDTDNNLYLHTPLDPANNIKLTNSGDCRFPAISPSGNLVAFFRGNDLKVMRVAAAGTGATQVGIGAITIDNEALHEDIYKISWTRDGKNLIYGDGPFLKKTPVDDSPGAPSVGTPANISPGTSYRVSSATDTFDGNGIIYVDNYASGADYDPWVKRDSSDQRLYLSVNFEDGSVERNPRGENEFMITRGPAFPQGNRQLRVVHITGVQAADVGPALTSAGSNTRPVWTQ